MHAELAARIAADIHNDIVKATGREPPAMLVERLTQALIPLPDPSEAHGGLIVQACGCMNCGDVRVRALHASVDVVSQMLPPGLLAMLVSQRERGPKPRFDPNMN